MMSKKQQIASLTIPSSSLISWIDAIAVNIEDYMSETFGREEKRGKAKVIHFSNLILLWLNYSLSHFISCAPLNVYSSWMRATPPGISPTNLCTLKPNTSGQTFLILSLGWADWAHELAKSYLFLSNKYFLIQLMSFLKHMLNLEIVL